MAFTSLEALYGPNKLPSKQTSNDIRCGDSDRELPPTPERIGLINAVNKVVGLPAQQ
jgi:hypothetical protein